MSTLTETPRLPPQNLEAEQSVLGAILLDNASLAKAVEVVSVEDFYRPSHQTIFLAMLALSERGKMIDNITLSEHLNTRGELEAIGGAAYLAELVQAVPSAANIRYHCHIIKEKARCRKLKSGAVRLVQDIDAGAAPADLSPLIDDLKAQAVDTAESKPHLTRALLGYDDLLRAEIPKRATFLPWLMAGSIAMVFGPRGIGKTMFSAGLATSLCTGTQFLKWSTSGPVGVLYVDGEMPLDALRERFTRLLPSAPKAPLKFLAAEHVYYTLRDDLALATEGTRKQIIEILADQTDIKVLILDNVSCLFTGINEDKKQDWEPINAWLIRLRHRGITTVLVHHAAKGGQQRGTSSREDALDITIHLDRPADYDPRQGCRCELHFTKSRGVHGDILAPLEVWLNEAYRLDCKSLEVSLLERARHLYEEGVTSPSDLAEELRCSKGHASRLLKKVRGPA